MEKIMKLKQARDVILAYLIKEDLTVEETKQVLQMCNDEVDAAIRRMSITEVKREDFPVGENVCEEQIKGARPGGKE